MKINLLSRSSVAVNATLFVLASIYFIFIVYAIEHGVSSFSLGFMIRFYGGHYWMPLFGIITAIAVYRVAKTFSFLFPLFYIAVTLVGLNFAFRNFDKKVLLLIFSYMIIGFYFVLVWVNEMQEAIYRPFFSENDVGKIDLYPIEVELRLLGCQRHKAILTNWSSTGCFIKFDRDIAIKESRPVILNLNFEGYNFVVRGIIASSCWRGAGIRILTDRGDLRLRTGYRWSEFIELMKDRLLLPKYY